jgi:23S rRNA pseudouridine1911/1915/1917 synthase
MPTLLEVLKTQGLSGRQAREALSSGKVRLGSQTPLPVGDGRRQVIAAEVRYNPSWPRLRPGLDLAILHSDPTFAVVYKPAGLLSVPASGRPESNVIEQAGKILGPVFSVHRLDEETSGLMLVARTEPAQELLKNQLEHHEITREYEALVLGKPENKVIRSYFIRNRGDGLRGSWNGGNPPEDARYAVTHIERLSEHKIGKLTISRVHCKLETGRTHQIRIHLAEEGCPVLGDPLYGNKDCLSLFPRLALHAMRLELTHPISRAKLLFKIPLPDDMALWLDEH